MTIKIVLDEIVLIIMLFQVSLGSYLGLLRRLNPIILLMILIRLVIGYKQSRRVFRLLLPLGLFYLLYIINIFVSSGGKFEYARRNFLVVLYPMIQLFYVVYINEKGIMIKFIEKYFIFLNMFGAFSIVVGFIQYYFPGSFAAVNLTGEVNTFLGDSVYGLFGYNQQHTFGLYLIFLILCDFQYIKLEKSRIAKGMIIFLLISSTALFAVADNKAFLLLLPLSFIILVIFDYLRETTFFRSIKLWKRFVGGAVLFIILFLLIPSVRSFLQDNVINTVNNALHAINMGNKAYGTTERIAIILWALKRAETWVLGIGFDKAMVFEGKNYLGFAHFGQSDLGAFLILGGIWMTLIIVIYVYGCFYKIAGGSHTISIWCKLLLFIYTWLIIIYTQVFSRVDNMLCVALFVCLLQLRCVNQMQ